MTPRQTRREIRWAIRYLGVLLRQDDKTPCLYLTRREALASMDEFHRPDVTPVKVTLTYTIPKERET